MLNNKLHKFSTLHDRINRVTRSEIESQYSTTPSNLIKFKQSLIKMKSIKAKQTIQKKSTFYFDWDDINEQKSHP